MSSDSRPPLSWRRWTVPMLVGSGAVVLATTAGVWLHRYAVGGTQPLPPTHLRVPVPHESDDEPAPGAGDSGVLRVCADGNNLPFSNRAGGGFENRLAELVAADLGRSLQYYWWPQRRGFVRQTLNASRCDMIAGIPARSEMAWTTRPYYRSSYVFVSRHDRVGPIRSFDDPRLRRLRLGVPLTGEDYENPPALQALATRHIVDNVRPFLVYGDYSKPNPLARLIDDVVRGEIDVAVAWGPTAGFFARASRARLDLVPVHASEGSASLSFAFPIAMAVRHGDRALHDAVDDVLERRRDEVDAILTDYGVPRVSASYGRSPR